MYIDGYYIEVTL